MLTITRRNDNRFVKCIEHRIADIRGGVGVKVGNLGGSVLCEGTPIGYDSSTGLYKVVKTAKVLTDADASATTIEVAKGHHFKAGDYLTFGTSAKGQVIASIDKSDASKDVITLSDTLGAAIKAGAVLFEVTGNNTTKPVTPTAIVGDSYDVVNGENLFVNAWVIATVKTANCGVAFDDAIKSALKCIAFV